MYTYPYNFRQQPAGTSNIFAFAQGDVNGDYIQDQVYLVGQKTSDSPYITDITLIIQDGRSNLFYNVPLKTNMGYQPRLFLGDFTGDGTDDILISMDSGGSGGFGYYYLYSFVNNQPMVLFDYETFDETYKYVVNYQDQYKVEVINQTLNLSFIIDLSNRDQEYLDGIYNQDGTLKAPLQGWVSGLNQLYPVDFDGDGVYDLYALQRIVGQYNADGLGLVQTPLSWDGQRFSSFFDNQYAAVLGTAADS
ncbi:VCBS repeat-containing protein [Halobacillus litoralis]|uniref:Spore coat protein n=1 Tax=Halobacillus litoralis TaxID=45668 RepID=A0A410MBA5_9BACI|nr:VCBS repeat-containing protein [Halobacillus litoralis]QAS52019.1 spore coat protein [Halobacillus litoralis]